ncbi:MAG: nitroreductase family protein [Thermomicrobiales bacterium]
MPVPSDSVEFLAHLRQTRAFTDEPVSDADLHSILDVMRWTGSAGNAQPWQFIVVRDAATRKALSQSVDSMNWLADAPLVLVVVLEEGKTSTRMHDLGRMDERILLAAQALGLGAGIVSFWNAEAKEHGRTVLQIPDGWVLFSAVGVGHPSNSTAPSRNGGRKELTDLVHWDRFGPGSE